jgi:serine/threonine protein kinase
MGQVFQAHDPSLQRDVAIKMLPEDVAADAEQLARLRTEARLLASLNHPHIATVHSLEEADGQCFLVMELIDGDSLADRIAIGPPGFDDVLDIAMQVAEALEAAHEAGIVHRDLKPENVLITNEGRVKVLDFGLAKPAHENSHVDLGAATTELTVEGTLKGTIPYMSPKQARGEPVDKRTDIWAFGCLFYELLAGRRAFERGSPVETLSAILNEEPDWDALPSTVPHSIRRLLRRCLNKDDRDRLRDIGDARLEIREARRTASEPASHADASESTSWVRRVGWIALLLTAVVTAVVAVPKLLPKHPIVYLIDTASPLGVYDLETRRSGGTNADDLTDVLGALPVTIVKETSSPFWRREHQVLAQKPTLVVIHLSAFAHQPGLDDFESLEAAAGQLNDLGLENPLELGRSKLLAFLGYLALGSPETKFVVYSRGTFAEEPGRAEWTSEAETRFPELEGRITAFDVPGGLEYATFRDPATAQAIKDVVISILGL